MYCTVSLNQHTKWPPSHVSVQLNTTVSRTLALLYYTQNTSRDSSRGEYSQNTYILQTQAAAKIGAHPA